jgi:hypothetical protein
MGHTPVPFTFYLATATTATAAATDSLPTVVSLSTLRLFYVLLRSSRRAVTALASPTCDLYPLLKIDKEEKRIQEVTTNFHCLSFF